MDRPALVDAYRAVRGLSLKLCEPLEPEDFRVQTMTDVSPPWWNLGHTTWFFAKNVLEPWGRYTEADARLEFVLNSYYEALGPRIDRDRRHAALPYPSELPQLLAPGDPLPAYRPAPGEAGCALECAAWRAGTGAGE